MIALVLALARYGVRFTWEDEEEPPSWYCDAIQKILEEHGVQMNDPREHMVMKRILVVDEKHETRYFDASNDDALHASALKLLHERINDGYWYNIENQEIAERIVEEEKGKAAWKFLHRRRDHEYEHVRLEDLE